MKFQRTLTRIAWILAAATLSVVPLMYASHSLYPLAFPKAAMTQLLVEALFGVSLVLWLRFPETRPRASGALWSVVLFFLVQILAAAVGVDWHQSLWSDMVRSTGLFFQLHVGVFAIVLGSGVFTQQSRRWLAVVSVVTAAIVGFIAILQRFVPDILPNVSVVRVGSTLGNPLFFSAYALLSLGCAGLLYHWYGTHRSVQWMLALAAVLLLVGVYLAQARGTLIGLGAGVGTYLFLWMIGGSVRRRRIAYGLLGCALLAGVGLWFVRDIPVARSIPVVKLFVNTTTLQTRFINWHMAWEGAIARPILGWGPENYRRIADAYFDTRLSQLSFLEGFADKPHNLFLELFATSGVLGVLAYFGVVVLLWRVLRRAQYDGRITRAESTLWYALAIGNAVQLIFLFETTATYILTGLLVGYVLALTPAQRAQTTMRTGAWRTFVGAVGVVVLCAVAYHFSIEPWHSSNTTNWGLQYTYVHDWNGARGPLRAAFDIYTPYTFERWRWASASASAVAYEDTPHQRVDELPPAVLAVWKDDIAFFAQKGEELRSQGPDSFMNDTFLGKYYYQLAVTTKDPSYAARALNLFDHAITLAPKREDGYLLAAQTLDLEGKYREASDRVVPLLADPHASLLVYWYAAFPLLQSPQTRRVGLHYIEGMMQQGKSPFENPKQVDAVAQAYVDEEDFEGLVRFYEYVTRRQHRADWYQYLAAAYAQTGRYDQARVTIEKAVDLDPSLRADADAFLTTLPKK